MQKLLGTSFLKRLGSNSRFKTAILQATAFALCVGSPLTFTEANAAVLEEIVVTARKREENLQDVPVSVQAFSGDYLKDNGIVDFQALAPYTPNFSYATATGASDILVMRGLGTVGSGPHFEQAVGQVLNGVFTTRSRLGRTALIDLSQIEVLKGPQGPIIGKNTSLGAINITSKKPTEELEIEISAGVNFENSEGYEVQGIVSGPLGSDAIRGRLVVDWKDFDGWHENVATGNDDQRKEDLTTRLTLVADLSDSATAELIWQHNDLDRNGKVREPYACLNPAVATAGPAGVLDCKINGKANGINIVQGVDVDEPFTIDADVVGLTFNWDFANATLTAVTGYSTYEIFDNFDVDFRPIENFRIFNEEEYSQFSQEIRIVSNGADVLDYIAGVNYFTSDMDFIQNSETFPRGVGLRRHEEADSDTDSIAAFGQVDWHISDEWNLTLGGRITKEEREGSKSQIAMDIYTNNINLALCDALGGLSACSNGNDNMQADGTPITGDIDETNFSWNVSLQWRPVDGSMYYVSVATGFKSGGFDLRGAGNPQNFIFDEEESTNIELGGKHTLADGSVRFNWTLFHTNVDGLQVSSNDPVTITQTVNNVEATAQGLEFDVTWGATEALTLGISAAYTDVEYDEFLGSCYWQQNVSTGCNVDAPSLSGNPATPPTDPFGFGPAEELQDHEGETLPFAPEISMVLSADYTWLIGDMDLTAAVKWIYTDEQEMQVDNNPLAKQDAFDKVDASLTLASQDGIWKLSLVGRNLTDEISYQFSEGSASCPGGPAPGQTSCLFTSIDERRVIAVKGTYKF